MSDQHITIHHEPGFDYWGITSPDDRLYEVWRYRDGRPDVFGVDCAPVASLPRNPSTDALLVSRYSETFRMHYTNWETFRARHGDETR